MKTADLISRVNNWDYCSIRDFCKRNNFKFPNPPVETKQIGETIIETYEVQCEDGIVTIKGSAITGPEWTDFGVGYIIAY